MGRPTGLLSSFDKGSNERSTFLRRPFHLEVKERDFALGFHLSIVRFHNFESRVLYLHLGKLLVDTWLDIFFSFLRISRACFFFENK